MFCANCGKKIDDDTRFCPHCGAEADAPDAPEEATPEPEAPQPEAPAPVASAPAPEPVTPEPESSLPAPEAPEPVAATPEPAPAAVGASSEPEATAEPIAAAPPPVAAPPAPATAAPPPTGTAPSVTDGEPPKKGSSKCWFIGCGILLVVIILGGIGTCLAVKKGGEVAQDIREQLEDQGFEIEGLGDSSNDSDDSSGDDDSSSSSDNDSAGVPDMGDIDWDQVTDNMPEGTAGALEGLMGQLGEMADSDEMREAMQNLEGALPKATMHMFFIAWQLGNVDEARKLMTDECSDKIDDVRLQGGYTQISMDVQNEEKLDDGGWMFRVEETFRVNADSDEETELYLIEVVKSGDRWLVNELTTLERDE